MTQPPDDATDNDAANDDAAVNDRPLTKVQKLVIRAALAEEEFSYFDLAELTGRSRENLRKIKNEISARFPDVFVSVGQDEATIGRKSTLWAVNPRHAARLRQLCHDIPEQARTRAAEIREFPILEHARRLLTEVQGVEPFRQREVIMHARSLLNRTRSAFDAVGDGEGGIAETLRATLRQSAEDADRIETMLIEREEKTARGILAYLGEDEEARPIDPVRPAPLDDMVQHVCHAPPGSGSDSVFEFDTALILSAEDPDAEGSRRVIAETLDERTFLDNVAGAVSATLRSATAARPFRRVAERLLGSFPSLRLRPDIGLADELESAADLSGLDPGLREEARRLADMLQPRGRLAGQDESRPFTMSAEDRMALAGYVN